MADLTLEQTIKLKTIVLQYLNGDTLSNLKFRLQAESFELKTSCKSLYQSITIKNKQDDPLITAILHSLNIKKSEPASLPGRYEKLLEKSNNLYELLKNLCHDSHHHVDYLLQEIEKTNPATNWTFIFMLGALISAGLGALFYAYKEYIEAIAERFVRTFPSIVNWLGVIYTGLILAWNWYNTFAHGTVTTIEKSSRLFFKTLAAGLTISAYILSYLAAGAMTFPAAMLLALSSSIDVIQSAFNWFRSEHELQALAIPGAEADWEVIAEYERTKSFHQLDKNAVWIKIGAAILITIAAGIWNFFPPSLLITISCIAFISLIELTKHSIQAQMEESYARNLQTTLAAMGGSPNKLQRNPTTPMPAQQEELLSSPARALTFLQKAENTLVHATPSVPLAPLLSPRSLATRRPANDEDIVPVTFCDGSSALSITI